MTTDGAASATARRAYAVAHGWEHASALSAGQSAALGTVAQAVIGTKWRRDLARARVDARERNDGREMDRDARESERAGERASTSEDEGGEGNLSSARAFYAWYASVEETVDDERRETHRRRADALRAEIERREAMLRRYDAVERGLATMAEKRAELKARSRRTQEESERMIAEKDRLEEFADALRDKLNYFDQLEKVAEQFQAGAIISAASDASCDAASDSSAHRPTRAPNEINDDATCSTWLADMAPAPTAPRARRSTAPTVRPVGSGTTGTKSHSLSSRDVRSSGTVNEN